MRLLSRVLVVWPLEKKVADPDSHSRFQALFPTTLLVAYSKPGRFLGIKPLITKAFTLSTSQSQNRYYMNPNDVEVATTSSKGTLFTKNPIV